MLPNFYILGAQKAGTTWLASMLRQHDEIFIPRCKELHYFTKEHRYLRGASWYQAQFRHAGGAVAIGEATPNYLAANTASGSRVVERIHALTPDARFIVCLRNPAGRAMAALLHHARKRRLAPWTNFDVLLQRMLDRRAADPWDVLAMGRYDLQLEAYLRTFPSDRFLILILEEDLQRNPVETLRRLCGLLGVRPDWPFHSHERAVNSSIQSRLGLGLAFFAPYGVGMARMVESAGIAPKIALSAEIRATLEDYYRPSIVRLEEMMNRRLDCWRRPER